MKRMILAVLIGFSVAFIGHVIVFLLSIDSRAVFNNRAVCYLTAMFAGGFVAGCFGRQRGWVYGLVVGILMATLGHLLMNTVDVLVNNHAIHPAWIVEMTIESIRESWTWSKGGLVSYGYVIIPAIGGFFGQFLAQIFPKRSQEHLPPLQAIVGYYNYSRGE